MRIITYTATYKAGKKGKGRNTIVISSLNRPPPIREFQGSGTKLKPYKLVNLKRTRRRMIVVAATKTKKGSKTSSKGTSKSRKKPVDQEELEELEGVEELDEILDEEDEEEVEAKKSKKKKGKKGSRAAKEGKVGTTELAEHFGVDARTLRVVLRKHNIAKDSDSNRYEWDSFEDKTVRKIGKLLESGEAEKAKKESFDKLKAKGEKKKGKKNKEGKKNKKSKKKAPVEDDDDEE